MNCGIVKEGGKVYIVRPKALHNFCEASLGDGRNDRHDLGSRRLTSGFSFHGPQHLEPGSDLERCFFLMIYSI